MKTDVANRFIWFKGEILNVNDAKINILAPTAQFGLNVFEGIPCYWNDDEKQLYAFRLDDHYDRLLRSAKLIQINCPYSKEELKKAFVDVIKANEYDENLSVRQTLFVDGFGSWGRNVWGMFVVGLYATLWSFLLIVPGIIKFYAYAMTPYILIDNPELPANQAIYLSKKMMKGHKFDLFYLHLSFIGWFFLSIFTLGIGLLWVVPYMMTAQAAFYQDVKKEYNK